MSSQTDEVCLLPSDAEKLMRDVLIKIARMVCWSVVVETAGDKEFIGRGRPESCECYSCSAFKTLIAIYGEMRVAVWLWARKEET